MTMKFARASRRKQALLILYVSRQGKTFISRFARFTLVLALNFIDNFSRKWQSADKRISIFAALAELKEASVFSSNFTLNI